MGELSNPVIQSDQQLLTNPKVNLAVILGASEFPEAENLQPSEAFTNSAGDFLQYLISPNGLGIPMSNICFIFDDDRSADDTDRAISQFLRKARLRHPQGFNTVLFYYVGHGMFESSRYCLALRSTRTSAIGPSAYFWDDLARTIHGHAKDAARIFIVDACFSGAAQPGGGELIRMSDENKLVQQQAEAVVSAQGGSALLCASSRFDFALAPVNKKYTMFSEGLLHALRSGDREKAELLTLEDVRVAAIEHIQREYPKDAVRPELHLPNQRNGPVSNIPMFPNRAKLGENFGQRFRRLEDFASTFNSRFDEVLGVVDGVARDLQDYSLNAHFGDIKELEMKIDNSVSGQQKLHDNLAALSRNVADLKIWIDRQMPGETFPELKDPRAVIIDAVESSARANFIGIMLFILGVISAGYATYAFILLMPTGFLWTSVHRVAWCIANGMVAIFLLTGSLMSREKWLTEGLEPLSDKESVMVRRWNEAVFIRLFYAITVRRAYVVASFVLLVISALISAFL